MLSKRISTLFAFLFLINGCVSGPAFKNHPEPKTTESLIYIYRPSALAAAAGAPNIYIDGVKQKATLDNGGYMAIYTTLGKHIVEAKGKNTLFGWGFPSASVNINSNPQSEKYIRLSTSVTAIYAPTAMDFGLSFSEVSAEQGGQEIKNCSFIQ